MHAYHQGYTGSVPLILYSFDCNEPMHVHAERERMECKFWLNPLVLASNDGFTPRELNRIHSVIQDHEPRIRKAWDEHCPKG